MLLLSCPDMCSYDTDHSARIYKAADTFTASHTVLEFTGKVFISTPRTPDRRTHRCKFNTARGPLDPLTPGTAAVRVFKGLGLACSIKTSVARSGDPVGILSEWTAAVEMPPALVRQPSSLAGRRHNHEESPRSRAIRIFSKVDVNDDGSVTLAELKAYLATHEAMGFKSLDDETTAKMFSALDVNHDGTVSLEEWAAVIARAAVAPEFKEASALAAAPPAPPLSRPARSPARGRPGSGFSVPVAAASASRATPTVPATQLSQEQACAVLAVMCAVLLWGVSLTTHALTDYACTRFVLALAPYVAVTIVALFAERTSRISGEWWRKQRLCRAEAVQRAPPPPRSLAPLASPAPPPPRSLPPLASPAPPPPRSLPPLASPGSREEREDAARRAVYLRRVPPEPLEGAANKTLLCVHTPAGSRVWRRFESSDTLEDLANFARSLSGVPLGSSLRLSNVTMYPHRPLNLDTQIGLSLYTLEMWPSAHVQVSDADAAPADAQR